MDRGCLPWILLYLLCNTQLVIQGIMIDIKHECCNLGIESAQERNTCTGYTLPDGISLPDHESCSRVLEVCCVQELQTYQCTEGIQIAREGGQCKISTVIGSEDFQECCHCCHLGIIAHDEMPYTTCDRIINFGDPCDEAFTECCSRGSTGFPTEPPTEEIEDNMDECTRFPNQLCAHTCINTHGSFMCACDEGYTLQTDGRTCAPVRDPCQNSPCDHDCDVLSNGNIVCSCFDGYQLQPNGVGCGDIDECTTGTDNCQSGQNCVNIVGSYRCDAGHNIQNCDPGYQYNTVTNNCDDTDECLELGSPCGGLQCINTPGAYRCQRQNLCDVGLEYNTRTQRCEDINECALGYASCLEGQRCVNSVGSYQCQRVRDCGTGYTLNALTQQCVDDNECELGTHNCALNQNCVNQRGSFRCEDKADCGLGMNVDSVGNCVDINECNGNPCPTNSNCYNTVGSYRCAAQQQCGAGFEVDINGLRCVDVDECSIGTHECKGDQRCVNTNGGFNCECPVGYKANQFTRTCEDIDECTDWRGRCQQKCENTEGSYRCTCQDGFELAPDGVNCRDINECVSGNQCSQQCVNYYGSYQCLCERGYRLDADKVTCNDIDECSLYASRGSLCVGVCTNIPGSYKCTCPAGYTLLADNRSCRDIDECEEQTDSCSPTEKCFNTRGGHRCHFITCPQYFVKASATLGSEDEFRCIKQKCAANDIDCLLENTDAISYNHISLPSNLAPPRPLITMRAVTTGGNPRIRFRLAEGNQGGWFDVVQHGASGTVRMIRNVNGPFQTVLRLEMDRVNNANIVTSRTVAYLYIYISSYIF